MKANKSLASVRGQRLHAAMTCQDYHISNIEVNRSLHFEKRNSVSWSRQGHIAYTLEPENDDGFIGTAGNLRVTYLECMDGKHWQLAPPTIFSIETLLEEAGHNLQRKHLAPTNYVCFSNTGWDLLTADKDGHVTILVTGIKRLKNNKPNSYLTSQEDVNQNILQVQYSRTSFNTCEIFYSDLHKLSLSNLQHKQSNTIGNQILTGKWLNLDKSVISNIPAMRIQQNAENQVLNGCASKMGAASDDASGFYYRYNAQQHKSYGAVHPLATKQACIILRRNGEVCLFHQEEHGIEYDKVIASLNDGENSSSYDTIDKASIGFQKDGKIIIAAYYEISKILKFYEIDIEWNYLDKAAKLLAENPNYRVPNDERTPPKLLIKKIHQKALDNILGGYSFVNVDLISPNFEVDSMMDVLITLENSRKLSTDPVKSMILRYQLKNILSAETIHQSFKDIASKNNVDVLLSPDSIYKLEYLQALMINDSIITLELLHLDMYFSVVVAGGAVKVFERKTFSEVINKFSPAYLSQSPDETEPHLPEAIYSLLDAGFEFPKIMTQPVYCSLSPNMCAYVFLPTGKKALEVSCVTAAGVDKRYLDGKKKGLILTKAAALALRHTTACYFGYFTDDLVATTRNDLMLSSKLANDNYSYRLMISVVQEAHRAINLNIDIPPEQSDKMTQNQPLQRLLTLQLSLGTSENWKKTRSGKIALALVNLRYVASSVMYTIHTIYSNMQRFARKGFPTTDTLLNAKMREECILSVIGVIRWCLDYVVLLSQELLELDSAFKSQNPTLTEKLIKNSIVIPLILGKIPRAFLVFSIANIRRLFSFIQKFVEKNDSNLTAKITTDNPLGAFDVIEDLLVSNDISVVQRKFGGNGRSGSGANSKTGKAIVTTPTVEAYYRLGLMIKRLPVSLIAFEKFLSEADGPLRNMKLDPPMSLAVEQQIVCQGYVSKNFVDAMKKLSEVFSKSVLNFSGTKMSDLYFYDVSWLGLDTLEDDEENEDKEAFDYDQDKSLAEDWNMDLNDDSNISHDYSDHGDNGTVKVKQENSIADKDNLGSVLLPRTDMRKSRKIYGQLLLRSIKNGGLIDDLRKEWVSPEEILAFSREESKKTLVANGTTNGNGSAFSVSPVTSVINSSFGNEKSVLRKCIRCGAISVVHDEVMFIPNSMSFVTNPVFQHYQRICICGGSWANL